MYLSTEWIMNAPPEEIFVRIKLERSLWADFRREAIARGKYAEDLAADALRAFLQTGTPHRPRVSE